MRERSISSRGGIRLIIANIATSPTWPHRSAASSSRYDQPPPARRSSAITHPLPNPELVQSKAAEESAQPGRSKAAAEWDAATSGSSKPLPPTHKDGKPSATGIKAKFEALANPEPPKKTMGKVAWHDEREQVRDMSLRAPSRPRALVGRC